MVKQGLGKGVGISSNSNTRVSRYRGGEGERKDGYGKDVVEELVMMRKTRARGDINLVR